MALARAFRAMFDQRIPRDAAAISYFSLFALFPAALVLLAVGNDLLNLLGIRKNAIRSVTMLFPVSRGFLESNLPQIMDPAPTLVLSCLLVMIWTSSWIFGFIESGLNRAWGVQGRRSFWQSRFRSISVVALGGFILLVSAGILAIVTGTHKSPKAYAVDPIIGGLWTSVLLLAVLLLAVLVFFCVYKLMPDRQISWVEALSGAVVAALLWEFGSFLFFKLVPYFDFERIYGRMAAIVTLMGWVYTSNLILLFGGNFSARLHQDSAGAETPDTGVQRSSTEQDRPDGKIRSFPRSR